MWNDHLAFCMSGSAVVFGEAELREMTRNGWVRMPDNVCVPVGESPPDDQIYSGYFGPSAHLYRCPATTQAMFFYFLPHSLWVKIASETNRYWRQTFDDRLNRAFALSAQSAKPKTRDQIEAGLLKFKKVWPHEVVQWLGLWLAHVLCPHKRMHMHWAKTAVGAIPAGSFNGVMSRNRFDEISRFIHFSDNTHPLAQTDRAWKIRPVLNTLLQTFKSGYVLGYRVSLDEGMLPSRNRHNPTRTYMKDKPHKWGTKCVLTCCAVTGYCKRVELDVGTKEHRDDGKVSDTKSGPAAAVRNVAAVFRGENYQGRRLLVTDNYYTSIPMAQQLRTMGFNFVGTIRKDRLGWCQDVLWPQKKRPKSMARGLFKMAYAQSNPSMVAVGWMDNRPVYFLGSGVNGEIVEIERREKNGDVTIVPCPALVKEYQTSMGGVDRHDQLRLQSYSMQMSTRFRKYYKSLFLGLVDMALVNAYISINLLLKRQGKPPMDHNTFYLDLQKELVACSAQTFNGGKNQVEDPSSLPMVIRPSTHALVQTEVARPPNSGSSRRRHRLCKVCAVYKGTKRRGGSTTWFCQQCSAGRRGLISLCNHVRGHDLHPGLTCSQIWHGVWADGAFAPKTCRDRKVLFDEE